MQQARLWAGCADLGQALTRLALRLGHLGWDLRFVWVLVIRQGQPGLVPGWSQGHPEDEGKYAGRSGPLRSGIPSLQPHCLAKARHGPASIQGVGRQISALDGRWCRRATLQRARTKGGVRTVVIFAISHRWETPVCLRTLKEVSKVKNVFKNALFTFLGEICSMSEMIKL